MLALTAWVDGNTIFTARRSSPYLGGWRLEIVLALRHGSDVLAGDGCATFQPQDGKAAPPELLAANLRVIPAPPLDGRCTLSVGGIVDDGREFEIIRAPIARAVLDAGFAIRLTAIGY